jgi:hypothetical protein
MILLADLSRCALESLKVVLQEVVPENDPIPDAVIAMQTFGDLIGHNPHCHILVTDGCPSSNTKVNASVSNKSDLLFMIQVDQTFLRGGTCAHPICIIG